MPNKVITGELAFEEFNDSPPILWRLVSIRPHLHSEIRHVKWFATEEATRQHAKWIEDTAGGTVLSVCKYVLAVREERK